MVTQPLNIIWFRRDLRLGDNQAVANASQNSQLCLPIFIIDPFFFGEPEIGIALTTFMFESLVDLDTNLRSLGSKLRIFEGSTVEVMQSLTEEIQTQNYLPKLFFNKDIQLQYGLDRDTKVRQFYSKHDLEISESLNYFLLEDEEQMGSWRKGYYEFQQSPILPKPDRIRSPGFAKPLPFQTNLEDIRTKYSRFWQTSNPLFVGGENQAQAKLKSFLDSRYVGYHWRLSRPWLAQLGSTSQLSPHIAFGTISARKIFQDTKAVKYAAREIAKNQSESQDKVQLAKTELSLEAFLDRMRWRDSFTQRLYFHPEIIDQNRFHEFNPIYNWEPLNDQKTEYLKKWQSGTTGFPLIDASMRQLLTQGWMNFRMRAMCATFLSINCGISWHWGARHFMNYLIDGDVAINHWQWQMQAGITNPLSPAFRIYNPTKNLLEKDPDCLYIKFWLPELQQLSVEQIMSFKPAPGNVLSTSYPSAMFDFDITRKINGKVITETRKTVRSRILAASGKELNNAKIAKEVVIKYKEYKNKKYKEYQNLLKPKPAIKTKTDKTILSLDLFSDLSEANA